ncbi:MAG: response regulator transcription factor [Acidimicrobiales bacterium]|nr:response regulator transcription factor [Acidimicrobiales bacterium]
MRILVVEDDASIAEPLREGLLRGGFEVDLATNAAEALQATPADLVLLDLGLPDLDGNVVCQRLREKSDVPIIVVSARGEEIDRVLLLELGADDYVVKPFGLRELIARIHAISRRARALDPRPNQDLTLGSLHINQRTREVLFDGRTIELTPREYDLLVYLAQEPGTVRTRDEIIRSVWDEHWWGPTKTLDVHIASLRKKLSAELIQTVRSVGYRLLDPTEPTT